ncbi:glycosyltransferase family 2 protein [Emticicia sp. BO119]|uniref:glycosyltransferase family 2 protein n=1 Tax=Emticicia sp. BO119 TaxID=2757768 RepID=UPI0015F09486|nr:glycosyltransferase family 2 protein [Emticicia sp. BO119]MBA4850441.1 glycosyltransferase family 2 protein [Emticicia sp. BO119]
MRDISLIILAYNDADSLLNLVPDAYSVLEANFDKFELIVVDDCSSDNTAEMMESFKRKYNNLVYQRNPTNKGVGYNFQKGVKLAKYRSVAYTDGDGQFNLNDLVILYNNKDEFEVVSGNRETRADGIGRWAISKVYNLLLKLLFNVKLKDTNSALKIYRREIFDNVLPLRSNDGFYDAEVIIKSMKYHYTIKEIPVMHYPRQFGVANGVKWKSVLSVLKSMMYFWYGSKK